MIERRHVFRPWKSLPHTPADFGLAFEDVHFQAIDGVRLHGWYIPGPKSATLLYFHGNTGNIGYYAEAMQYLHSRLGVTLLVFDYRGYGNSEGRPTEQGLYRDADAAVRWLQARHAGRRQTTIFYGHSLGTAIALEMALRHKPEGVVLEAPLTSIRAITRDRAPWAVPLSLIFTTKFENLKKIPRLESPVLIIHGAADSTIPVSHGRRLYEAACKPKYYCEIPNGTHTESHIVGEQIFVKTLNEFIEGLPQSPAVVQQQPDTARPITLTPRVGN